MKMADTNINPSAFVESSSCNDGIDRSVDQTFRPVTVNITNGQLSGDVRFEFATGADEWIQMSKCYVGVDYTINTDGAVAACVQNVAPALFTQAQFRMNDQVLSSSNNYTQDWYLSNRLQYSYEFNKHNLGINYKPTTARVPAAATYVAAHEAVPISVTITEAVDGQCNIAKNTHVYST